MKRTAIDFGSRDGQAIILVVVGMGIFMLGAIGLAIDGGQMYAQRQMAQAAADAAAGAGIMSILKGTNATATYTFGTGTAPIASYVCTTTDGRTPCVYARDNGFGATASDTVTLSYPTTVSGVTLSSGNASALTVTVQRTLNSGLIRFVGGPATSSITARATTGLTATVSPDSIYVLDPSAPNAFQANGSATVAVNGGAIVINSVNNDAASISGSSNVAASAIDVTGGVVVNGSATITPAPVTGTAPATDPFASLPAPVVGACNFTNYSLGGSGTAALTQGTYCGGISISGSATATFAAGNYVINGGGIAFSGSSTISGSGVMFYLTGTNSTYGSVTVSGSSNVTFSAPTSGSYLGVLFFQNRSITSGNNATFGGSATTALTGSLYFPTTSVSFSGSASAANYMAIVADQVSFSGSTNITHDPTGLRTGLFLNAASLLQ